MPISPSDKLTALPEQIVAGTSIEYTRTHADYPAGSGWTVTLYMSGPSNITPLLGTVSGDNHVFTLTAALTGVLIAGDYQWSERASKAGKVYEAASGSTQVLPDMARATAGSTMQHAQRLLVAVEEQIEKRVAADMSEYSIAQRHAVHEDLNRLRAMRTSALAEVEAARNLGTFGREITASFPPERTT